MDRVVSRQPDTEERSALASLTAANLADLYRAFAVPAALRPLVAPLLEPFARRFARELLACDARTAEIGLQAAMREVLERFGVSLHVSGMERMPATGPLLITSNHPGLTDAPALLACLARPDLYILSAKRGLLEALPAIHARLIVIDDAYPQRTVYRVARHLRAGGALLTFPAGRIEPDPAVDAEGAEASLGAWSPSLELFVRLEPRTQVVPAAVSGVITPATLRHPLTTLHRDAKEKAWLAASLQIMFRRYQRNRVSVRFAAPLGAPATAHDLVPVVLERTRGLF
jgi:1-acyl-sn-glycerol-3-phosphate acyltransferase